MTTFYVEKQRLFREELMEMVRKHVAGNVDATADETYTALLAAVKADTTPRTLPLAQRIAILNLVMPIKYFPNADGSNLKATHKRMFPDYVQRKKSKPSYLAQEAGGMKPFVLADEPVPEPVVVTVKTPKTK